RCRPVAAIARARERPDPRQRAAPPRSRPEAAWRREASCPWLPPVADCLSREVELPQELGRGPVETRLRHVADIAQVLSSDGGRIESTGREVAIEREEAGGIALGIRRPRNVTDLIADRVLVGRTELRERRPRTPSRFRLEPREPVA